MCCVNSSCGVWGGSKKFQMVIENASIGVKIGQKIRFIFAVMVRKVIVTIPFLYRGKWRNRRLDDSKGAVYLLNHLYFTANVYSHSTVLLRSRSQSLYLSLSLALSHHSTNRHTNKFGLVMHNSESSLVTCRFYLLLSVHSWCSTTPPLPQSFIQSFIVDTANNNIRLLIPRINC